MSKPVDATSDESAHAPRERGGLVRFRTGMIEENSMWIVRWQPAAVELADDDTSCRNGELRLQLYREGKPYREQAG